MHVVVWSRCGDKDCTHWKIIYIKKTFPLLIKHFTFFHSTHW